MSADLDRLARLLTSGGPNGSFHLTYNHHHVNYQTAAEWWPVHGECLDDDDWVSPDSLARALAEDSVWQLTWYPRNPIGSYTVLGATLAEVVRAARAMGEP